MGELMGILTETREIEVKKTLDASSGAHAEYLYTQIKSVNSAKLQHSIFKNLFKFLTELYRKLSIKDQTKGTY
jgi:transcription initiation factor IIE alpha subunit